MPKHAATLTVEPVILIRLIPSPVAPTMLVATAPGAWLVRTDTILKPTVAKPLNPRPVLHSRIPSFVEARSAPTLICALPSLPDTRQTSANLLPPNVLLAQWTVLENLPTLRSVAPPKNVPTRTCAKPKALGMWNPTVAKISGALGPVLRKMLL